MNVYQRLNEARTKFHALKLEKTGHNKFAGYYYFELGDFLIPALKVFADAGLCAVVSFGSDKASMLIRNVEKPDETILIESPMGSAALKGCHEVQNIGAVETYQRRYLWVAALEIVEHDALDATTGKEKPEGRIEDPHGDIPTFSKHESALIRKTAQAAITAFEQGNEWGAFEEVQSCVAKIGADDTDRQNNVKLALSKIFGKEYSALRSALKRMADEERQREKETA